MKAAINSIPVATTPKLENVTVTPTEQQQQIETTTGDYLGVVTVNAITATYVGSGVTKQGAKTIIPTKSAQTAVNANVYTTGVIAIGAIPNEYIIPSGTTSITVNGTVDVKNYAQANVNVAGQSITLDTTAVSAIESEQTIYPSSGINGFSSITVNALSTTHVGSGVTRQAAKTITPTSSSQTAVNDKVYTTGKITVAAVPSETTSITTNGTYSPSSGKWFSSVTVNVPIGSTINNQNKSVTPNSTTQTLTADSGYTGLGTVTVSPIPSSYIIPSGNKSITANGSNIDVKNYATVSVDVPSSGSTINNQAKTATPSESSQEITPDTGYTGLSKVTVNAITATYVGSEVARKSSSDLTASGATINVPAGYYSASASKSVATATQATPAITVSSGGLITAAATQTAGYVSAGTKTTTSQMAVKAATTYTPTTSNQTIAAGTYLTGIQTIKGDANLIASNIISGKSIFGVNGNVVINKYYTGTSAPASSLGSNGDIYLQE